MKKKTAFIVLSAILVIGIGGFFSIRQYTRSLPPKGEPKIHESWGISEEMIDYYSCETNDFIVNSDLIVRGTFTGETDGPKFLNLYRPFSCEGLHVIEVYKGDCKPGDDIEFAHIGGVVSLYQMLKDGEKRGIKKSKHSLLAGYPKDLKSYDLEADTVYRLNTDAKQKYALPEPADEYILFLSWNRVWNCYDLGLSQKNRIRKINEKGEVWNPFEKEYETIDWEIASKLTMEDIHPGFVSDYDAHREEFEDLE